jgi:hypothetical protein
MGWDARLLAALLLSTLACVTKPAEPPLPPISAVLLAPVSFNQNLPAPLEPGADVVRDELAAQLEARGLSVATPSLADFHDAWLAAAKDIGTLYDEKGRLDQARFDAAVSAFLQSWRAKGEPFDVLLLGYFHVQGVKIYAGSASWDGVERRVRVDREGASTIARDVARLWPNRTPTACVSLRLVAYSADGRRLFEQRGGLEIVDEYRLKDLDVRHRTDLFTDRAVVQEGVAIALEPLFPE